MTTLERPTVLSHGSKIDEILALPNVVDPNSLSESEVVRFQLLLELMNDAFWYINNHRDGQQHYLGEHLRAYEVIEGAMKRAVVGHNQPLQEMIKNYLEEIKEIVALIIARGRLLPEDQDPKRPLLTFLFIFSDFMLRGS